MFPDFEIRPWGDVSNFCYARGILSFAGACDFVRNVPYRRNENKLDPFCILVDQFGTCSTKHALLKRIAEERGGFPIDLMLGVYRMNAQNTPKAGQILEQAGLKYLPEAHNFLRYHEDILDCTWPNSRPENFVPDLMEFTIIHPEQIGDFKVSYHQEFLKRWVQQRPHLKFSFEELWSIREACIAALSESSFLP